MKNLTADRYLTVKQVAELLQVEEKFIYRRLRTGEIKGTRLSREWRIRESDLAEYLERNSNQRHAS